MFYDSLDFDLKRTTSALVSIESEIRTKRIHILH